MGVLNIWTHDVFSCAIESQHCIFAQIFYKREGKLELHTVPGNKFATEFCTDKEMSMNLCVATYMSMIDSMYTSDGSEACLLRTTSG